MVILFLFLSFHYAHAAFANVPFLQAHSPDTLEASLNVAFADTDVDQISIRYRVLAASQTARPYLFLIGGGPGIASIGTYVNSTAEGAGLSGLPKYFRTVIFDQRGLGQSSPLDRTSAALTPEMVMQHFSAKNHARDLEALIHHLVEPGEEFYVLAHSYGAIVLQHYLANPHRTSKPTGVIFVAAAPAQIDSIEYMKARMHKQILLNQKFLQRTTIVKIRQVRRKIAEQHYVSPEGLPLVVEDLDILSSLLSTQGVQELNAELDALLDPAATGEMMAQILAKHAWYHSDGLVSSVYACDVTPPFTSRQIVRQLCADLKRLVKDWTLFDYHATDYYLESQRSITNAEEFENEGKVENAAAQYARPPPLGAVKGSLQNIAMVYVSAQDDYVVPTDVSVREFGLLNSARYHQLILLPDTDHDVLEAPENGELIAMQLFVAREELSRQSCQKILRALVFRSGR